MSIDNKNKSINLSVLCEFIGYSRNKFAANEMYIQPILEKINLPLLEWATELSQAIGISIDHLKDVHRNIAKIYESDKTKYDVVSYWDDKYPKLLRDTRNAPACLFYRGDITLLNQPAVSVVGTRNPSKDGELRAQKLAMILSSHGFVIASGLAMGIDGVAHKTALKNNGKTVAVIGTPINRVYPKQHEELQEAIAEQGLVISQFPLNIPVTPANFPIRNYTMSGISAATVVVEAGETSGSLIQAQQCIDQGNGRKLFILKNVLETNLKWPQKFKSLGAIIIEDANLGAVINSLKGLTNFKPTVSSVDPISSSIKVA